MKKTKLRDSRSFKLHERGYIVFKRRIIKFKNKLIDETLITFQIGCSLSMKGCPYHNAVTEATFKFTQYVFFATLCASTINL